MSAPLGGVAPNHPGQPVATSGRLPMGLRVLAIVVSVLKALPVAFGVVALVVVSLLFGTVVGDENDFAEVFTLIFGIVAVVLAVVLFLAVLLLAGQTIAAIKQNRTWLIVVAAILAAIDVLLVIGSAASLADAAGGNGNDSVADVLPSLVVIVGVAVAQIAVLVWAIAAKEQVEP